MFNIWLKIKGPFKIWWSFQVAGQTQWSLFNTIAVLKSLENRRHYLRTPTPIPSFHDFQRKCFHEIIYHKLRNWYSERKIHLASSTYYFHQIFAFWLSKLCARAWFRYLKFCYKRQKFVNYINSMDKNFATILCFLRRNRLFDQY